MLAIFKRHPYLSGAAVIIVVVGVYSLSSGGGQAVTTVDQSNVATGDAMQLAAQQAQQQSYAIGAAVQSNQDTIGGQISLAQIAADAQNKHDLIVGNIASQQINADQQTTSLVSTLNNAVQIKALQNDIDKTALTTAAATQQTQIIAGALTSQAQINAGVASAAIANARPRSFFESIFG